MTGSEPPGISVYDRLRRSDEQLLRWLADGTHAHEAAVCLGEVEYQLLAPLARQSALTRHDPDFEVLIIPGIMGSQLGRPRTGPWPADLMWIDPVDVSAGRLLELGWPDQHGTQTLGCIPYTYFALKLRLEAAGFTTHIHSYDWRAGIAASGAELAARIANSSARHVALVAHSMGGLLARAALAGDDGERVQRVVTLGTPHHGTLAAVQALRATYPTVRRLAALDPAHSAEDLTARVFHSFPSLFDMLPEAGVLTDLDLFDVAQWPTGGPRPDEPSLHAARLPARRPPGVDARFIAIAGTGQRTASRLRRAGDDFEYEISSDGDGTVPLASALLGAEHSHVAYSEHSGLPRSEQVAHATIELLRVGHTAVLPRSVAPSSDAHVRVTDERLRETYRDKVDWRALSNEARATYLNQLNLAPPLYRATAPLESR